MSITLSTSSITSKTNGLFASLSISTNNKVIAGSHNDTPSGLWFSTNNGSLYQQSNIKTGSFYSVYLFSDDKAVALSYSNAGIYKSTNAGQTWTQTNVSTGSFFQVTVVGSNLIATSISGNGIWYSSDSGATWTQSNVTTGNFSSVSMSGTKASAGSGASSSDGFWYSTNSGVNWTKSASFPAENITNVLLLGDYGVAGSFLGNGIYYTTDAGTTWTQSSTNTGIYFSFTLRDDGTNLVGAATSLSNGGIYYTNSPEASWTPTWSVSSVSTGNFRPLVKNNSGTLIAGSNDDSGVRYSTDDGQTWTQSNKSTGKVFTLESLPTTTRFLAGSGNDEGLWVSTDSGATWTNSSSNTDTIMSSMLLGSGKAIAGSSFSGLWYSSNNAQTWTQSSKTSSSYGSVFMLDDGNAIAASISRNDYPERPNTGIWYSTDYGINWTQSNNTGNSFVSVYLFSSGIALASSNDNSGLWRSTNYGQTWTQISGFTTGNYSFIFTNDVGRAIVGSTDNSGVFYSSNYGQSWGQSNLQSGAFGEASLLRNDGRAVIGSMSNNGLWYSNNNGQTWIQSNVTSGSFSKSFINKGGYGIAVSYSNGGILYTTNYGVIWNQSNKLDGSFYSLYMDSSKALAGSTMDGLWFSSDNGITWTQYLDNSVIFSTEMNNLGNIFVGGSNILRYSFTSTCYNENTTVCVFRNNRDVYESIKNLRKGDMVKMYKGDNIWGYKKIKYIHNSELLNDPSQNKNCMYKHKLSDLIVTGYHSILVNSLDEDEYKRIRSLGKNIKQIHDKKMVIACCSNEFEKVLDNKIFTIYHIVLEDTDVSVRHGIYVNGGILSETASEKSFLRSFIKN